MPSVYSFTAEDDFHKVSTEVMKLQASYYLLGIELGLPSENVDAIQSEFHQNVSHAFNKVVLAWLEHRYQVEKHGLPTWRRLVEAVDGLTGGNNSILAKKIAQNHPAGE